MYLEIIESRVLLAGPDDTITADADLEKNEPNDIFLSTPNAILPSSGDVNSDDNDSSTTFVREPVKWPGLKIYYSAASGFFMSNFIQRITISRQNHEPYSLQAVQFIELGSAIMLEHFSIFANMPKTGNYLDDYLTALKNTFIPGYSNEGYLTTVITYGSFTVGVVANLHKNRFDEAIRYLLTKTS